MPVIEQEIKQLEKQFDLKSKDPKEVVINIGWCIVRYIIWVFITLAGAYNLGFFVVLERETFSLYISLWRVRLEYLKKELKEVLRI